MVLFNYAIREVTAKLVYYGPGLCGKTTNLQFIHEKLDPGSRGKLLSLATDGDRTLFFDFLPIEMGSIGGYKVRFQLYTVPGQVHYNATRKLVLKGVDAVVFVADSQVSMVDRNRESFENLIENLIENGYDPAKIPVVIQLNKRDLPNVASVGELVAAMGVEGYTQVEACAARGDGVFETLKAVVKLTLGRLKNQFDPAVTGAAELPAATPPFPFPPSAPVAAPAAAAARKPAAPVAAPAPPPSLPIQPPAPPRRPPPPPPPPPEPEPPALDEFDLTDFAGEPPATVAVAEEAEISVLDEAAEVGSTIEDLMEAQLLDDGDVAAHDETVSAEAPEPGLYPEQDQGQGQVPEQGRPGDEFMQAGEEEWITGPAVQEAYSPVDSLPAEPPPWAVQLMEEQQQLRVENQELREALRGLAALLGRQSDLLNEGRDELERRLAASGEVLS